MVHILIVVLNDRILFSRDPEIYSELSPRDKKSSAKSEKVEKAKKKPTPAKRNNKEPQSPKSPK